LGVTRIDYLLSMSSDKYDAIHDAGIEVLQRVALPDIYVPKNATVEITAKISAGYHSDVKEFSSQAVIDQLRNLPMVRTRCLEIFNLAKEGKTRHFNLDEKKIPACVDYVLKVTRENYPDLKVPYHSRWRHFDEKDMRGLVESWKCDKLEKIRRKLDLATISVLLDAGAGTEWKYRDKRGNYIARSEGLAIASFDMLVDGVFSSDPAVPHRVNALGLKGLTKKALTHGLQIGEVNKIVGFDGRWDLLHRLGKALQAHPEFFGDEVFRPGHVADYLLKHATNNRVSIKVLWRAVITGFESIWPSTITGVRRGDVWVYTDLKKVGEPGSDLIPFHKLSQWLTYSLLEPLEELGLQFDDLDLLTGLAEYRNGGLFIDMGVLSAKNNTLFEHKEYDAGSEPIVEWRALTVCLLDVVGAEVRKKLKKSAAEFPLAKVLQGGTWAAGRKIAKEKRPATGAPPISVRLDGTVF